METMKDYIQPFLDLIKNLVQPQEGTKFLVTVAGLGTIYLLHAKELATNVTDVVIALMVIGYYVADIFHKVKKQENGK